MIRFIDCLKKIPIFLEVAPNFSQAPWPIRKFPELLEYALGFSKVFCISRKYSELPERVLRASWKLKKKSWKFLGFRTEFTEVLRVFCSFMNFLGISLTTEKLPEFSEVFWTYWKFPGFLEAPCASREYLEFLKEILNFFWALWAARKILDFLEGLCISWKFPELFWIPEFLENFPTSSTFLHWLEVFRTSRNFSVVFVSFQIYGKFFEFPGLFRDFQNLPVVELLSMTEVIINWTAS